jgi:hypothetical protein
LAFAAQSIRDGLALLLRGPKSETVAVVGIGIRAMSVERLGIDPSRTQ